MYLVIYKKGLECENIKIEFDRPLTIAEANDLLVDAIERYKISGISSKIGYKIIESGTGEVMFNSKITINNKITTLFSLLYKNANVPRQIVEYVKKVENREIKESLETFSFNNHIEEKIKLDKLKTEKNEILQTLKRQEKDSQQRELAYEKKLKALQEEKKNIEKSIQLKEKEEQLKESERLEAIKRLEEENRKAAELMEQKRLEEKRKKEEHEKRLRDVEAEAKKAEIALESTITELEMSELKRLNELKSVEEQKNEAERQANILLVESDKNEVEYKRKAIDHQYNNEIAASQVDDPYFKLSFKEKLENIDFEQVKNVTFRFLKISFTELVKFSKKMYQLFKRYRENRAVMREERLKRIDRQAELEEKIALEKINFMKELQKEKKMQEKEIKKLTIQKEKEALKKARIEKRYLQEMKRSTTSSYPFYNNKGLKTLLFTVGLFLVLIFINYNYEFDTPIPVINEIRSFVNNSIDSLMNK